MAAGENIACQQNDPLMSREANDSTEFIRSAQHKNAQNFAV